ncbi:nucleolar and coiled-body phosphoprotein 1-like [Chenopodium quinoa]|uniref:nucleolar and coiled-body phosphoprotein 1-like n=1 Tax=Chenopodium quinoa TaxID=63459 RepID=UPI000B798926|nr:nucleolar and coiled-body phosphoprotein 1-like [Chenopodium quinoa]
MARIKTTGRITNSDDSYTHYDLPDHRSGTPSTPGDSILRDSGESSPEKDAVPAGPSQTQNKTEESPSETEAAPTEPLQPNDSSDSSDESDATSESQNSLDSEEMYSRIHTARESLTKAMEKVSASKKAESQYRLAVLGKRPTKESPANKPAGAAANQQVKDDLEAAKEKIKELKLKVSKNQGKADAHDKAVKAAEDPKTSNARLKQRLANQEKQLAQKYKSRFEEEKRALVADMMEDCSAIMKMTRDCLYPNADYSTWGNQFAACTQEHDEAVMGGGDGQEGSESSSSSEEEVAVVGAEGESSKKAPEQETVQSNQVSPPQQEKAAAEGEVPPTV